MEILGLAWDWVVPFLVVLSILVFVHELGHYWVARRCGVRVEVFSIGFGPEIRGWTDRRGTRWKFSAIPLGGYVKMFGEHDFDDDEERPPMSPEEQRVSFHHRPLRQRAAIVAAGPIANFAFAVVVLALLFGIVGLPAPLAGVGAVQEGSAAAAAGLKPGDLIARIDGQQVKWFEDVRRIVSERPGVRLELDIVRGAERLQLSATPTPTALAGDQGAQRTVGVLGIKPDSAQVGYERVYPWTAAAAAVSRTVELTGQILTGLWEIIAGARGSDELGGPIRIAQISGEMAQGGIVSFILFMAALSVNLGLINLLPVPLLDGGHLAFYAIEAVRGKPLERRVQEYGFRFGLILVLLLMIFATWNDLVSLKVFDLFR